MPGDASARTFGSSVDPMNPPAINDDGVIAFAVRLHGGTEPESSIWKWTPDGVSAKIVEEGIMLPGLPPDRTLEAVLDPIVDARGDVLFLGLLDGDSAGQNDAYWLHTVEGEFIALLRTGQQAPGLPNGIQLAASNYVEVSPDRELAHMALSDGGLALLEFALAGPGVDDTNDRALYVVNRAGEATLVVRRGDAVQTAAGEMRTVDEFSVWYGFRGETARRPVNDRGDVVAILAFTDETSALVRFSTPEPSAGTAIASASLALTFAFASRGRPRTRMVRWRRRLPHRGP